MKATHSGEAKITCVKLNFQPRKLSGLFRSTQGHCSEAVSLHNTRIAFGEGCDRLSYVSAYCALRPSRYKTKSHVGRVPSRGEKVFALFRPGEGGCHSQILPFSDPQSARFNVSTLQRFNVRLRGACRAVLSRCSHANAEALAEAGEPYASGNTDNFICEVFGRYKHCCPRYGFWTLK